jgi:diaminopimelate decarboxylase/aspartate kinase
VVRPSNGRTGWVVVKFGGTSVSSAANWREIAAIVGEHCAAGSHVLIVHSAVSGITDQLDRLLAQALAQDFETALGRIEARHLQLLADLGLQRFAELDHCFAELRQIVSGVALMEEASDRTRARVMGMGELLATHIGAAYLKSCGLPAAWVDARTLLRAERRANASEKASFLSATCDFSPDPTAAARLAALSTVVITQGFIASDDEGHTVLLGRGGSDTSAAYLAAKLSAQRLEIWTDVPGMFSANPRSTPTARQLRTLTYDEAQEIATAGAKVLHPRCILPARQHRIPLWVFATHARQLSGTLLTHTPGSDAAQVKAVCIKKGITLVSMDSPGMWHQVGFLADAFAIFKELGLSVDLVSTSETNVTVSLDPQANAIDTAILDQLIERLAPLCRAQLIGPCASVSLVGRNIRAILHQLGDALALFEEQRIYLVSQAANDLNFTFVVDEEQGDRLVDELHDLLVRPVRADDVFGPTWQQLFAGAIAAVDVAQVWWAQRRDALLTALGSRDAAYVYDLVTVRQRARELRGLNSIARVFYAMKANWQPDVLRAIAGEGLSIECVSRGEVEHARRALPSLAPTEILFTPNFASRAEYEWALAEGLQVTVDNAYILAEWGESFRGRSIFLRIDPGTGRGHHQHVRTGGTHSKFGIPDEDAVQVRALVDRAGARVIGLHAHVGSGVSAVSSWAETATTLLAVAARFPEVRTLNIGGGLAVADRAGKPAFDLQRFDRELAALKPQLRGLDLWLEPGRYLVAEAGVLLARVTQLKSKDDVHYVGVSTGMNSLIRPALYGAHHDIHNLTRLGEPETLTASVVGPICESGDFLGHDRVLAESREGDVILIANAGAYGAVMSSNYNLRTPAAELVI